MLATLFLYLASSIKTIFPIRNGENKPTTKQLTKSIPSPINYSRIFDNTTELTDETSEEVISIFITGDIMLGRSINSNSISKNDYQWAFRNISNLTNFGDITLINLESPFNSKCERTNTGMRFCADEKLVTGISDFGVDVANIANNHISDQGKTGFKRTQEVLMDANIAISGMEKPAFITRKDTVIAFLGFNDIPPHTNLVEEVTNENVKNKISRAKDEADFVVVSFHWGNEYQETPTQRQIELAHTAIDNGADLIVGNHPHWIQPLEIYNTKPIFYSLGNFVFDQMWSRKTSYGLSARVFIYNNETLDIDFHPIIIENYGQPRKANEIEKMQIMQEFITLTKSLNIRLHP